MEKFLQKKESFENPEDELAFLRERIEVAERALRERGITKEKEYIASDLVEKYRQVDEGDILHPKMSIPEKSKDEIVLRLSPEPHDNVMEELLGVLLSRGIKNAISVAEKLNNPHVYDDFHRFLVQYLVSGKEIPGLKNTAELYKRLNMRLFEITIPDTSSDGDKEKSHREIIAKMEQFLAGMSSVGEVRSNRGKDYYSLEIAQSSFGEEVVFYVAVPGEKVDLLEKMVLGIHPDAKITEEVDDYNIFVEGGETKAAFLSLDNIPAFPIKTYDKMEYDPLNIILNVFSKLKKEGEGAAVQILVRPEGDKVLKKISKVLDNLRDGKKPEYGSETKDTLREVKKIFSSPKKEVENEEKKIDEKGIERVIEKMASSFCSVSIRIIASSSSKSRSNQILEEIISAFNQFGEAGSNRLVPVSITDRGEKDFIKKFIYREYEEDRSFPLNLKEISSIIHFPKRVEKLPHLKTAKSGEAPVPTGMPEDGVLIGENTYRGANKPVYMAPDDRMRHLYVIGQTGTGKTSILKNLIYQDIINGDGCCFIDPHGTDVLDILSYIPPERYDDVIYFDPSDISRPMGLNMLEYDYSKPEQKTFVVNEMINIFNQLYDMKVAGGPQFEQYFRNSALLVMEDPESGSTLMEITRVLQDKSYRDYKLSKCQNPIIKEFWRAAEATTGEAGLSNFVPYISSKFDPLISNDIMRPVIGQQKSAFDFRKIMDEKKILLVNLSKGKLGEINSSLIGLILVGKIQMAALSRVDSVGSDIPNFYLYIDEFQNVTTPSISSILSEARKYKLSLNVAHQYISQLDDDIKNAVFGNVGSMAVFRVSPEDAEFLEPKFAPTFSANDIIKLENRHAYMSMIVRGAPTDRPFSIRTVDNPNGDREAGERIKELSSLKYGREREIVEKEIMEKYRKS